MNCNRCDQGELQDEKQAVFFVHVILCVLSERLLLICSLNSPPLPELFWTSQDLT